MNDFNFKYKPFINSDSCDPPGSSTVVRWGESRIPDVGVDDGTETRPLVQRQGNINTFIRGFDGAVLRAVGLVPLSEVHVLVARRHADVVSPTCVLSKTLHFRRLPPPP